MTSVTQATMHPDKTLKRVPYASIIIENVEGKVLLLLRDNQSTSINPNHWTLIGRSVEDRETAEMAAQRELLEATSLNAALTFWKRYERQHPLFIVDQHIYTTRVDTSLGLSASGKSRALQFFEPEEIQRLKIGYGFKALLYEYFLRKTGKTDVHHS